ncbi:aldolase/citrate lyase family protein [Ramlibacter tataouinensis]|uniref:Candidate 4-hydroxy-2-oxovalerate aldolase n=1 Tax=Ramlibacter tataouinensis (strain ATCC BAA-407 / DSM 14655 / LMG 21543 / TTB310) TaxID=365046 RepID=F5Y3W2_RAMTT|nr:aldolase/citrate lyase family protein [Ramlibacter tataouinensis]AEG91240.1 Candidate 4-hydroxy-2-oxovalerate aldolase [Ramlibacter tataouinensis TTB310]
MRTPINPFKQALAEKRPQIGLWLGLADTVAAEICAGAGFDWLLIDGEHAPNDLRSILRQAQAIAGYPGTHAIARVPMGHGNAGQQLIKQYLDLGVQTLLVPMVDTPAQAAEVVRSLRYPPLGVRGMGGARASRWGRYTAYPQEANDQVCLLVQAESRLALDELDAIAAVDGVDGVFIGPADLSASLGHVGNPGHPEVQAAIEDAIQRITRAGKAAGILTPDEALARHYLQLGATFVAVGLDTNLLARGTSALAARFKSAAAPQAAAGGQTY